MMRWRSAKKKRCQHCRQCNIYFRVEVICTYSCCTHRTTHAHRLHPFDLPLSMSQAYSSPKACVHSTTLCLQVRPLGGVDAHLSKTSPLFFGMYRIRSTVWHDGQDMKFEVCLGCHQLLGMPEIPMELVEQSLRQEVFTGTVKCRACNVIIFSHGSFGDPDSLDGLCGECSRKTRNPSPNDLDVAKR